jgi:hypothetical protein
MTAPLDPWRIEGTKAERGTSTSSSGLNDTMEAFADRLDLRTVTACGSWNEEVELSISKEALLAVIRNAGWLG